MARVPIAVIAGLAGLLAYVAIAVMAADLVIGTHWALEGLYFLIVGSAWIMPMRWLMFWAARMR